MAMGVKTRRFDGKVYYMKAFRDTKREAGQRADGLRKQGANARITETTKPHGYAVWASTQ